MKPMMSEPHDEPSGASRSASLPLENCDRFGKYQLLRRLGEGAMGVVYLARDLQLGRQVALKITKFTQAEEPRLTSRLYREARASGSLHHPHICVVHDVNQIGGMHYIDMEYVEGETFQAWLDRESPLPPRAVAVVFAKIAQALDLAHGAGIIHRDIKPANLMRRTNGEPVIMDFGLARELDPDRTRLTFSGELVGTIAYIAPEIVSGTGSEAGPACDIYSLGVTLFQALTGRTPFDGSRFELLMKVLSEDAPPPTAFRPDVHAGLAAVASRMIRRDPGQRFASMAEVAAALEACAGPPSASLATTRVDAGGPLAVGAHHLARLQRDMEELVRCATQLRDRLLHLSQRSVQAAEAGREPNQQPDSVALERLRAAIERQNAELSQLTLLLDE